MTTITDLHQQRQRARRAQQAQRAPEVVMHAWAENGRLDTAGFDFAAGAPESGPDRADFVVDAAWLYACHRAEGCAPVLWCLIDGNGRTRYLAPPGLFRARGWRRSAWMLARWWRVSRVMLGYAWRMGVGER